MVRHIAEIYFEVDLGKTADMLFQISDDRAHGGDIAAEGDYITAQPRNFAHCSAFTAGGKNFILYVLYTVTQFVQNRQAVIDQPVQNAVEQIA
jgi:hypothetical protein